jgi:hypothetical protein
LNTSPIYVSYLSFLYSGTISCNKHFVLHIYARAVDDMSTIASSFWCQVLLVSIKPLGVN